MSDSERPKKRARHENSEYSEPGGLIHEAVAQGEIEQKAIDAEIDDLKARIVTLKESRNNHSITFHLPPELLSKVFLHCDESSFSETISMQMWTRQRLRISHVCRYWRNVALECPKIWSVIDVTSARVTQAFLERSKQTDLSLNVWKRVGTFPSEIEALLRDVLGKQAHRLRSLKFKGDSTFVENLLKIPTSAPNLEFLAVEQGGYYDHINLDSSVLKEGAPRLRELRLRNSSISWTSPLLAGLTSLHISTNVGASTQAPTSEQFIQAVNNMPYLKSLELETCLPTPDSFSPHLKPAPLTSLQDLSLKGSFVGCAVALKCLQLPTTAKIDLKCSSGSLITTGTLVEGLSAAWLCNPLSNPISSTTTPSPRITSMQISDGGGPYGGCIYAWFHDIPDFFTWTKEKNPPAFCISFANQSGSVMGELLRRLPLDQLRSLDLTGSAEFDSQGMRMFADLPSVESLTVHDGSVAESLLMCLENDPRFSRPNKTARSAQLMRFRNLNSLSLVRVDFYGEGCAGTVDIDDLLKVLMLRIEFKGVLEKLRMTRCLNLDKEKVKRLKEVVPNVEWDSKVVYQSPPLMDFDYGDSEYDSDDGDCMCPQCSGNGLGPFGLGSIFY
ncbi:hypothetical protein FA15DRAFT_645343 [Coprinopsis marcescibilis]|uniref:F-box domain-containing protein n=1 Tax=Coprinopsis marcescibilis TaxID=230819 RepID=A0A5C3KMK4_COPMA|nr:hypothetical protein FA15DRAFT_645343 [Coprinopsis marcescibilis]